MEPSSSISKNTALAVVFNSAANLAQAVSFILPLTFPRQKVDCNTRRYFTTTLSQVLQSLLNTDFAKGKNSTQ